VGASLPPRFEAIALSALPADEKREARHGLPRHFAPHPLYRAGVGHADTSNGRTIFGPCAGNPEVGVRREFEALGLDFDRRFHIFEEGLQVLRDLWIEGKTSFKGETYQYDDVAFFSGTEMGHDAHPEPPPSVVSNPRLSNAADKDGAHDEACRRILKYGEGWIVLSRAAPRPVEQLGYLRDVAAETMMTRAGHQLPVTLNIGESEDAARAYLGSTSAVSPRAVKAMDDQLGPVGTPADRRVVRTFAGGRRCSSAASARSTSSGRWSGSRAMSARAAGRGRRSSQGGRPDAVAGKTASTRAHRQHPLHRRAGDVVTIITTTTTPTWRASWRRSPPRRARGR
jgi:alkanesulfonate monooxygenase SsuD/methylene tetrahydromethanopterin reductase-like flavin-dependent oxidoreductase (luciferase family)